MLAWFRRQDISVQVVLGLVAALALWLGSGAVFPAHRADTTGRTPTTPTVPVARITPEPYARVVEINGATQADDKAQVAAEVSGQVHRVLAKPGDHVARGDLLVELELGDRAAQAAAAEANLASAAKLLASAEELAKEGYIADVRLTERRAQYKAAQQQAQLMRKMLADTKIVAPLEGHVEAIPVRTGDYVNIGAPVATVVGGHAVLLVGDVAQEDRDALEVGRTVSATLANGRTLDATLRFVANDANPATRTFRVEADLFPRDSDTAPIPTGMTAKIVLPVGDTTAGPVAMNSYAARIEHAWLVLGDDGRVGVMAAVISGTTTVARFVPVTLLRDTTRGLWVRGLDTAGASLITQGASTLAPGTVISPTTPAPASPGGGSRG